ncbi:hypothetical protein AACH06_17115 [Ideonella sp. DXS29W]|uniref:Uncharacterized protein n=1 Tax=Ideonella lacteola TaxID=2984193 RepID=A0ABU9BRG0_9BURK
MIKFAPFPTRQLALLLAIGIIPLSRGQASDLDYAKYVGSLYAEPLGTIEFSKLDRKSNILNSCGLYEKYFDSLLIERNSAGRCSLKSGLGNVAPFFRFPGYDAHDMGEAYRNREEISFKVGQPQKRGTVVQVPVDIDFDSESKSKAIYFFDEGRQDGKIVNVLAMIGLPIPMEEAEGSLCSIQNAHYAFALAPDRQEFYSSIPAPCDRIEWERRRKELIEPKSLKQQGKD